MNLGKLDDFQLGMGLSLKQGQTISKKHASFDGLADANPRKNKLLLILLSVIAIWIVLR